jgi:hypothetical protein
VLLVLIADSVGNHLVLGLLGGALVVLGALLQDILLNPVDTYPPIRLASLPFWGLSLQHDHVFTHQAKHLEGEDGGDEGGEGYPPLSSASSFFSLSGPPPTAPWSLSNRPPTPLEDWGCCWGCCCCALLPAKLESLPKRSPEPPWDCWCCSCWLEEAAAWEATLLRKSMMLLEGLLEGPDCGKCCLGQTLKWWWA